MLTPVQSATVVTIRMPPLVAVLVQFPIALPAKQAEFARPALTATSSPHPPPTDQLPTLVICAQMSALHANHQEILVQPAQQDIFYR